MPLPDDHHVIRICDKNSVIDPGSRKPLPVAFTFRQHGDGTWKDTDLSVFWLEYLHPEANSLQEQVAAFREYAKAEHPFSIPKAGKKGAFAVLPVGAIHAATIETCQAVLVCRHAPRDEQEERDGHSGIYPTPGVDLWPTVGDSAAHLAVRQFLWETMSHWEDAVLKKVA